MFFCCAEGEATTQGVVVLVFAFLKYYVSHQTLDVEFSKTQNMRSSFEKEHKKLFGHIQPKGLIEITKIQLVAIGKVPKIAKPNLKVGEVEPLPYQERNVWIDPKIKWFKTPVYDGSTLFLNNKIIGPAIINENTSTIFLGDGDELMVDKIGNYLIKIKRKSKN